MTGTANVHSVFPNSVVGHIFACVCEVQLRLCHLKSIDFFFCTIVILLNGICGWNIMCYLHIGPASLIVLTSESGWELSLCVFFFYFFTENQVPQNRHRNGSSDISYYSTFLGDSNDSEKTSKSFF